jgi:hypothetical protein
MGIPKMDQDGWFIRENPFIWRFPEMGPPNHPFVHGNFHSKPSILGRPHYGNPHMGITIKKHGEANHVNSW